MNIVELAEECQAVYPEPLKNFYEGQWWVNELDLAASSSDNLELKRAVATVHHLLKSITQADQAERVRELESDIEEYNRLLSEDDIKIVQLQLDLAKANKALDNLFKIGNGELPSNPTQPTEIEVQND